VVFFRDVDGVHSADPKLIATSMRRERLDYESLIDLAEAGAPILHAQAIEMARSHDLELEIRGLADGSGATVICSESLVEPTPVWTVSLSHPVSVLTVQNLPHDLGTVSRLLALLNRTDLTMEAELFAVQSHALCLTLLIPDVEGPGVQAQVQDFLREERPISFTLERHRRRVTVVGKGVGSRRVSQVVERLGDQLGPPLATFHGERHRAFVVAEHDGKMWLSALHQGLVRA
jgi:aspartate kinase